MSIKSDIKSTFNNEDIVVRLAKPSDYDGVMDIDKNVYSGRDILPSMYDQYLQDPIRIAYVAVYHGRIIGFNISHVIDDGETHEGEASRISNEFSRLGIAHKLNFTGITNFVLPHFPKLKRARGVTVSVEAGARNPNNVAIPNCMRILVNLLNNTSYDSVCAIISELDKYYTNTPSRLSKYTEPTLEDLMHLFKNAQFCKEYIPSGILIFQNKLFDLAFESNIVKLYNNGSIPICTTHNISGKRDGISFGSSFACNIDKTGFLFIIDYYGKCDIDLMKSHIYYQFKKIPNLFLRKKTTKFILVEFCALENYLRKEDRLELIKFFSKGKTVIDDFIRQTAFQMIKTPQDYAALAKL